MIFAILYSRYRSAVLALIVMGNIPLALIGSVVALWIAGQPLSVASMIGFITLAGIAARNGILKISHYINLALHEGVPFGRELDRARQPRPPDAGADDRAVGGVRAAAAADRSGRAGQGNPASGRRHDLRRPDQRHAARHAADAGPVPALRRKAVAAAARSRGAADPFRHIPQRLRRGVLDHDEEKQNED